MTSEDFDRGPAPGPPTNQPPAHVAPRPARRGALAAAGRFILRALRLLFVLMLVVIPVPVAALFARVFLPGKRAVATQTLKKE